jgi:hypothetical protein
MNSGTRWSVDLSRVSVVREFHTINSSARRGRPSFNDGFRLRGATATCRRTGGGNQAHAKEWKTGTAERPGAGRLCVAPTNIALKRSANDATGSQWRTAVSCKRLDVPALLARAIGVLGLARPCCIGEA